MIKNSLLIMGACLLIGFLALNAPSWLRSSQGDFAVLKQGYQVADFEFETIDNETYFLYDLKGEAVLIHFWATWCPPCLVEFPDLLKMAQKNQKISVIAISTDRHQDAMNRFLSKHDIPDNLYIVFDPDKQLTEGYFGTYQLPETLVLDADFKLHDKILGAYDRWQNYSLD